MNGPEMTSAFASEARALLAFGARSRVRDGFGWLRDDGTIDDDQGIPLWITGRMTHCFALGALRGDDGCAELAAHGIRCLLDGPLAQAPRGGWVTVLDADGTDRGRPQQSYDHSFVILCAASGFIAQIDGAADLLPAALSSFEDQWWDDEAGMVVDSRDPRTGEVSPYRGINANMHTVEALLAAWSATGDRLHLERALRITERVVDLFLSHEFRLPEHFSSDWEPRLDDNADAPADAFRPFGSTIGHWIEWSRLILEVRQECLVAGIACPESFEVVPPRLYRRALAEGWGVDGNPGFIYTVDFEGHPVVHQRMYWVLCEAIGAAAALAVVTGDRSYGYDIEDYWSYARSFLIERPGEWREELDRSNGPASGTWSGKPDIYHALQAMLATGLPVSGSFARALARRREGSA